MCGRFTVTGAHDVARELQAELIGGVFRPRYNVAPTQRSYCLRLEQGRRVIRSLRWGFSGPKGLVINARSERAPASLMFADAFFHRRCGVVADGFLEWSGPSNHRQPSWFRRPDKRPLVFAGLWRTNENGNDNDADDVDSFVVLTTAPNQLVASVHDRMPAIVDPADVDTWLAPPPDDPRQRPAFIARLSATLRPADDELLTAYPVSTRVNRADFDDPACLAPRAEQRSLF